MNPLPTVHEVHDWLQQALRAMDQAQGMPTPSHQARRTEGALLTALVRECGHLGMEAACVHIQWPGYAQEKLVLRYQGHAIPVFSSPCPWEEWCERKTHDKGLPESGQGHITTTVLAAGALSSNTAWESFFHKHLARLHCQWQLNHLNENTPQRMGRPSPRL